MKLSTKIYLGFVTPGILLIGIGAFSLYSFWRIDQQVATIYDDRVVPLQKLKLISDDYAVSIIDAVNKAHAGLWTMDQAAQSVNVARDRIQENWQSYQSTYLTPEEETLIQEVEQLFVIANTEIDQLEQSLKSNDPRKLDNLDGPLYQVIDPLTQKIQSLIDLQLRIAKYEREKAAIIYQNIWKLFILLLLLALIAISPIGFFLSQVIIVTLKQTTNTVVTAANEIAAAAVEHEQIATQQAASVEQTTMAMSQLNVASQQAVYQANAVAYATQHSLDKAKEGAKTVEETLLQMAELQEKVQTLSEQIFYLSEQTIQIKNISILVSDLANQTNILALNAAVEAAQFGQQGKGFGVVAGEIRKLADQSKRSAYRINSLIFEIQTAIDFTLKLTREGNSSVETGVTTIQKMANVFEDLAEAANNSAEKTQQISQLAHEQLLSIQQVVETMNQLALAAQETASGISQTKVGTQQLHEVALQLKAVI